MNSKINTLALIATMAFSASVVSADTVAYYRFDNDGKTAGQTADTIVDETGANNGAALKGGVGTDPLSVYSSDVFGAEVPRTTEPNSLSLDFERGEFQYVQVADDASLDFGDSSFTIEAWVKLESLAGGAATNQHLLWKKVASGVTDANLDYGVVIAAAGNYGASANGELMLNQGNGSSAKQVGSGLFLNDTSDWHYLSVAFDADNDLVRFVLDGQVSTVANTFTAAANAGELIIGGHFDGGGALNNRFDGLIDELRISNEFLPYDSLLSVPTPAALPAGLILLGVMQGVRRHRR
ncbi:LamG domain-containing protein [Planctomycetales bacterium ZRK34]|nr:LamG domain-containing protein [Planctomycetales bacterium ZRK34]